MRRLLFSLAMSGGFFIPCMASAASAPALAPAYTAQPCCELCPEAKVEANYNNAVLASLWPLVPGKDGWVFRQRTDFTTDFGPDPQALAMLGMFAKALKSRGTQLSLVYLPSRGLMSKKYIEQPFDYDKALTSYRAALARFRHEGVDVSPLDRLVGNVNGDFFLKRDLHWSHVGSEATAKLVASYLMDKYPFVKAMPESNFETKETGYGPVNGNWQQSIAQLCHQSYPSQYIKEYQTSPHSDLLSDEKTPDIVLIGTSFSASISKANFEGFLKTYLQRDVLNVALSGGEESGSWLEYLPSDVYQAHPPKLVLWELPSHYLLKDKSLLRQLIPLVNNGCQNKTLLMSKKIKVSPAAASNEMVFSKELLSYQSKKLVMDMKVSDPNVHQMDVSVWYGNGMEEKIKIKQNQRANTGGRFVFTLAQDDVLGKEKFISLDLNKVESSLPSVDFTVDVCELNGSPKTEVQQTASR